MAKSAASDSGRGFRFAQMASPAVFITTPVGNGVLGNMLLAGGSEYGYCVTVTVTF